MLDTDRAAPCCARPSCCANGGIMSVIGVYGGFIDKFPMGSFMNRYLTMRAGQGHVHRYMPKLLNHILNGDIDPPSSSPTGCRSRMPQGLPDVPGESRRLREGRAHTVTAWPRTPCPRRSGETEVPNPGTYGIQVGPVLVDVPRSIGYFGGVGAAVVLGLVDPPLGTFIAAAPFLVMLTHRSLPAPVRFLGEALEGAAKPSAATTTAT